MSTWAKYQLDRRKLRQARKAIPDVTWRLLLGYCQNPGELVLSEGRNYKLFFVLLKANPIMPMAPRDGCDSKIKHSLGNIEEKNCHNLHLGFGWIYNYLLK